MGSQGVSTDPHSAHRNSTLLKCACMDAVKGSTHSAMCAGGSCKDESAVVQTWRSVVVSIHDGPATELASFPADNGPVDCHAECLALEDCVVYETTLDDRYALVQIFTLQV